MKKKYLQFYRFLDDISAFGSTKEFEKARFISNAQQVVIAWVSGFVLGPLGKIWTFVVKRKGRFIDRLYLSSSIYWIKRVEINHNSKDRKILSFAYPLSDAFLFLQFLYKVSDKSFIRTFLWTCFRGTFFEMGKMIYFFLGNILFCVIKYSLLL